MVRGQLVTLGRELQLKEGQLGAKSRKKYLCGDSIESYKEWDLPGLRQSRIKKAQGQGCWGDAA